MISSQSTDSSPVESVLHAAEGEKDQEGKSFTYERRILNQEDVKQLSKDFDIVIIASGAGDPHTCHPIEPQYS